MIFVVNSWQRDQCFSVNITGYNVRYFLLMFIQVVEIEYNIFQHPLFIFLYITSKIKTLRSGLYINVMKTSVEWNPERITLVIHLTTGLEPEPFLVLEKVVGSIFWRGRGILLTNVEVGLCNHELSVAVCVLFF